MVKTKPCFILILSMLSVLFLGSCTNKTTDQPSLNIAYQYGIAYAPLIICQQNEYIEKCYKEATGHDISVNWTQMSSGADINTAIASNNINVGFMGIAPAISGISNNVGYKIFTNLSGQKNGLMTSNPDINSLEDLISSENQIALVNIGSIQHIILAKALYDNGYNAHLLDSYIVAMKHPDGMNSLESGAVSFHLTTNPYISKEALNPSLHEITEISDAWSESNSFIVGVASNSLNVNNPELYAAICEAIQKSIDYINDNPEDAAKITCEFNGNTYEEEYQYLIEGNYCSETNGIFELAAFMYDNNFIDRKIDSYDMLVFNDVSGN